MMQEWFRKVELEGKITYNLGHGEVVTNND